MSNKAVLSNKTGKVVAAAQQSLDTEDAMDYKELDHQVRELEAMAREAFQDRLKSEYRSLVKKLEHGTPLTDSDRQTLELLIVGEAKYYLRYENDFENWKNEIERLAGEIEKLQSSELNSIDNILHLQALCRDARNLLPSISYYLSERERLQRFKAGTKDGINLVNGQFLADFIKEMMTSSKM